MVSSTFAQVLADDQSTLAPLGPQTAPPVSDGISTGQGSLASTVQGNSGQILRWALWGQQISSGQWYQLDLKALLPIQESLGVASTDFLHPLQTRVGKTYQVDLSIGGLPTAATGANQTGEIYLGLSALVDGTTFGFRSLANYTERPDPSVSDPDWPGSLPNYHYNAWFLGNGLYTIDRLAPDQAGTEVWLIDWIETTLASSTQVDQASLSVLPSPQASSNRPLAPLYNGDPASLPTLDLKFTNLYPGSLTIFQLFTSSGQLLATLPVDNDLANADTGVAHNVLHFLVKLSSYLTTEGTYNFKAWTAESFRDGIPSVEGGSAPPGYTWTPLDVLGLAPLTIQFTARVQGTIITN